MWNFTEARHRLGQLVVRPAPVEKMGEGSRHGSQPALVGEVMNRLGDAALVDSDALGDRLDRKRTVGGRQLGDDESLLSGEPGEPLLVERGEIVEASEQQISILFFVSLMIGYNVIGNGKGSVFSSETGNKLKPACKSCIPVQKML